MFRVDEETEVYDNQIEAYFKQYFIDRGINLEKDSVKQSKYNAAWKYVYSNLFKPDSNTIRYNNKNSKIDYSDVWELNTICDIYIDLCFEYNITPSQYGFYRLTGITRDTLNSWKRGEYRGGDEKATLTHSYIVKKIDDAYKEFYKNNLSDTPVGQITMANNDEGVGLMYAERQAQADAWRLPTASREEIAQRYSGYKKLPQKPDLS